MNNLDIVFLVLMAISVIYSLFRGLVREIFSFLAFILGFIGASYGYLSVGRWLGSWVSNETISHMIAFALLFVAIALLTSLLGKLLSSLAKRMDLSWADRIGGAAFGLLKAVLLIAVIILTLTAFLPPKNQILTESKVSPLVITIARGLSILVPEKLHSLYAEKERELKRFWAKKELLDEKPMAEKGRKAL